MKCKDCTVFGCQYRTTDAEKDCYYEQRTAKKSFDWQSFRAEAAKDVLCAMLNTRYYDNAERKQGCVEEAIYFTDELISQLKNEEK